MCVSLCTPMLQPPTAIVSGAMDLSPHPSPAPAAATHPSTRPGCQRLWSVRQQLCLLLLQLLLVMLGRIFALMLLLLLSWVLS